MNMLSIGQVKYGLLWHSRASNSNTAIWPKFKIIPDLMSILVTCKFKEDSALVICKSDEDPIKNEDTIDRAFPHYKSLGAFGCHGNQSFDPICPKTLHSLSPTPMMLYIKFDQDWSTGLRDIQDDVGRRWRTDGGPLLYYKLTLWVYGSDELKKQTLEILTVSLLLFRFLFLLNRCPALPSAAPSSCPATVSRATVSHSNTSGSSGSPDVTNLSVCATTCLL